MRQCQQLLKSQVSINDARKSRIATLARDRLAYSEYKHNLEGVERLIEQAWTRRSSRKARKGKAKDKDKDEGYHIVGGKKAALPDNVKKALETRRRWLDLGKTFDETSGGEGMQGRFKGMPVHSIFQGIDEDGREAGLEHDETGSDD